MMYLPEKIKNCELVEKREFSAKFTFPVTTGMPKCLNKGFIWVSGNTNFQEGDKGVK